MKSSNRRSQKIFILLTVIISLVSGCSLAPSTTSAAPTKQISQPSPTSFLTLTPFTPTETPTPSLTPIPTPPGGSGQLAFTYYSRGYGSSFPIKGESNLFIANLDGSGLQPITDGLLGFNRLVGTSPDGKQVLVKSCPAEFDNQNCHLFVIHIDNREARRLDANVTSVTDAVWHPNGKIAYIADDKVYIVNVDGTGLFQANLDEASENVPLYISGVSENYVFFVYGIRQGSGYTFKDISIWFMAVDDSGRAGKIEGSGDWVWGFGYKISPDGNTAAWAEGTNIYIAPVITSNNSMSIEKDKKTTLPFPIDNDPLDNYSWLEWSPDSNHLWIVMSHKEAQLSKRTYHVWSAIDSSVIDIVSLNTTYSGGPAPLQAKWSPDSRQLAIFGYKTFTAILDLSTMTFSYDLGCVINPKCTTQPLDPDFREPLFDSVFWLPAK